MDLSLVLLLTQAEKDVGTADGIEAIENGCIGAVSKMVCVAWNAGPHAADQIGVEFGNEQPGCVGPGGGHDDVRADLDGKDLVGVGHRAHDAS